MGGRGAAPILGAEACDLSVRQVKGPNPLDNMRALKNFGTSRRAEPCVELFLPFVL
jgi:hypothetical protein